MAMMIGKIDGFGRIVIPKVVRHRLGLKSGDAVEITEDEGQIRLSPASPRQALRRASDGFLVLWTEPESNPSEPVAALRDLRHLELLDPSQS